MAKEVEVTGLLFFYESIEQAMDFGDLTWNSMVHFDVCGQRDHFESCVAISLDDDAPNRDEYGV